MQKNKIILIVTSLIILIIISFNLKNLSLNNFKDEIIFFKLFGLGTNTNEEQVKNIKEINTNEKVKKIIFNVSYKNLDFKNINLNETINKKTLINEKIAPGTQGDFEIELMSNENMEYEINFESYNRKPDNLVFFIKGNEKEFKNLDELEEKLKRKVKE